MLFRATAAHRQRIVVTLLVLAVTGGAIRLLAPNPSGLRDLGSLLLVLWVPVIGNVIAHLVRRLRALASPFGPGKQFIPQLLVQITPLAPPPELAQPLGRDGCALVVGTEGFSVRFDQPLDSFLGGGAALTLRAQFRRPDMALPHFNQDTPFRIVAQERLIGEGRVLQVLAGAARMAA